MPQPISVVVTNYNGRENLRTFLPHVQEALGIRPGSEIVVVDDGSSDDSVPWMLEHMPQVHLVALPENGGFPGAANAGFEASRHPQVLLLSSDMVPNAGCIERMQTSLESADDVFCVGGPQLTQTGDYHCRRFQGVFKRGVLRVRDHFDQPEADESKVYHQFQVAVGLYRRDLFLAVGGFCELFAPFYFEEVDLSYRAWKLGYRILYLPDASIHHYVEQSSIAAAHEPRFRKAAHRVHQYYMFWKNVDEPSWLAWHALWMVLRLPFAWIWGDWPIYRAVAGAWRHRRSLLAKRAWLLTRKQRRDPQILAFSATTQTLGP